MVRIVRNLVWLIILSAVYAIFACSPADPDVNSPGAGDRWKFNKVSGDGQSVAHHDTLANRLVVKLTTLTDVAIANRDIHFFLISGGGMVQKPGAAHDILELVIPTDFEGKATAQFFNFGVDSTDISTVKAEVVDSVQLSVLFTIGTIE